MERYNFTIHPKVRVGRLIGLAFVVAFFDSNEDAIAFGTWLEGKLANYAKVSVSKVIREAPSNEIPESHTITDTYDIRVIMSMQNDQNKRLLLTLPGLATDDLTGLDNLGILDAYGNEMNLVVSEATLGRNVIAGSFV